jgi:hypothetical protein
MGFNSAFKGLIKPQVSFNIYLFDKNRVSFEINNTVRYKIIRKSQC